MSTRYATYVGVHTHPHRRQRICPRCGNTRTGNGLTATTPLCRDCVSVTTTLGERHTWERR